MKELIKKLSPLLKDERIVDLIVFGSAAKSKSLPTDIDIAILVKEKDYSIVKLIRDVIPKSDVQLVSIDDIRSKLFLTLIKEGYSIKYKSYLCDIYGLKPVKLYRYDLKQLTLSKKVMFERGIKSIKGITKLSNRVVLVPLLMTGEFEDFLRHWTLDIDSQEYELVPLMRKADV